MKKNKGGRPPKIDDIVVKKLEEAFLVGATDVQACFYAGISKQTLYNYQEKNPEFIDRKEALKANTSLKAKMVISKAIDAGSEAEAKWHLERKEKKEYSTQNNQQFLDENGNPASVLVNINVPDNNN